MLVLRVLIDNIKTCWMLEFFEEGVQSNIMGEVFVLEICLALCLVHDWVHFNNLTGHYV